MTELVWVCRECGKELVRVNDPEQPGLVTFDCPDHGPVAFVMGGGQVSLEDLLAR